MRSRTRRLFRCVPEHPRSPGTALNVSSATNDLRIRQNRFASTSSALAIACATGRRMPIATLVSHVRHKTLLLTRGLAVATLMPIGTCCAYDVATMCRPQRELTSDRSVLDSSPATSKDRLGRMFYDHHEFVRRWVQRFGLSVDHADDAAAEAFLVAAERLDDIKTGSERAFLFGTALRVAQKVMRTERRWVLEGDMDVRFGRSATPETLAAEHRAVDIVSQVVSAMDLELQTAFVGFEFDGQTARQIAEDAGVPLGTVASRLRRARQALRQALTAEAHKTFRH